MKTSKSKFTAFISFAILIYLVVHFWANKTKPINLIGTGENTDLPKITQSPVSTSGGMTSLEDARKGIELHRQLQEKNALERFKIIREKDEEQRRLEKWKANFPYKPTYHPTLTFDPKRYDPSNPATYDSDPEMEMAVKNHGFMVAFYNNPQVYTAEFEQLYKMLKDIDRAGNPKITGKIFSHLRRYHQCKLKDQNSLWSKKEYVPASNMPNSPKKMVPVQVPIDGKTTWGDRTQDYHDAIVGLLVRSKYWPDKELLDANVARAFRNRLLEEIPSENLVKMQPIIHLPNGEIGAFAYYDSAEKALKPGDKLLYK